MSRTLLLRGIQVSAVHRCGASTFLRSVHARPSGKPTFVKGEAGEDSLMPMVVAFSAAFVATLSVLYLRSDATFSPSGLRPDQYSVFQVLESRKTTSPSRVGGEQGDHVYLKIEAPLARGVAMNQRAIAQLTMRDQVRILSIHMKEPALQIERPYTPLYADALDGTQLNTPLELLIKRYPDGELGKYAHAQRAGMGVELRGPDVTWQGPKPDHFVLIVGGTGITPAFQLLNTVFSQAGILAATAKAPKLPKFTLLYAATSPSSLLLLPELAALKRQFPEQIDLQLQVDRLDKAGAEQRGWTDWLRGRRHQMEGLDVRVGQLDEKAVRAALDRSGRDEEGTRKVLVCGPDGMVAHVSGPKQGKLQGKLGGILASLHCTEEEVWKL